MDFVGTANRISKTDFDLDESRTGMVVTTNHCLLNVNAIGRLSESDSSVVLEGFKYREHNWVTHNRPYKVCTSNRLT